MKNICCGQVSEEQINNYITVCGIIQEKYDISGVIYMDLKDHEGVLQVVCNSANMSFNAFSTAKGLAPQTMVQCKGYVRLCESNAIAIGTVELLAEDIKVFSQAQPLPHSLQEEQMENGVEFLQDEENSLAEKRQKIDVDHVAHLAMLTLSESEKTVIANEMEAFIDFASQLSSIDTKDVDSTAHMFSTKNVFRADVVENQNERESLLYNAPATFDGYITVPKVIK